MIELNHGASGYRRGCRCDKCREGQRLRMRAQRGSERLGSPAPDSPVLPHGGAGEPESSASGVMEAKIAREIEDLATGRPWTSACERLEEQALTAARIIDTVMSDGRLHLSTPQHRIIREALGELREILHPVSAAAAVDPAVASEAARLDQWVASLHSPSINCQPAFPVVVPGACSDCDRAAASGASQAALGGLSDGPESGV